VIVLVVLGFLACAVIGAWVRVGATVALNRWPLPIGTLTVNLVGSLVAGLLVAHLDGDGRTILVTGGMGTLTTYSSFANEVRAMVDDRRLVLAAAYVTLTAVGTVGLAWVGLTR
jgi:fluoride exporter